LAREILEFENKYPKNSFEKIEVEVSRKQISPRMLDIQIFEGNSTFTKTKYKRKELWNVHLEFKAF